MTSRRAESYQRRVAAAELARFRNHESHAANGEEYAYRNSATGAPSHIASFTKGLPHGEDGEIERPGDFAEFVRAIDTGNPNDFRRLPLGPRDNAEWCSTIAKGNGNPVGVRGWESMGAGKAFDLEGPDAQSLTMPPAPKLDSIELQAEMAEVYLMALARDIPFSAWGTTGHNYLKFAAACLNKLPWFSEPPSVRDSRSEVFRRRSPVSVVNLFRGVTPGADVGPYLSQFLIKGSTHIGNSDDTGELAGRIRYGAISIDQRVIVATQGKDYMTTWDSYLDVQNAADLRGKESYVQGARRLIATPRDLATYVHYDALYEAYLNACLTLLANNVPFDAGLPFGEPDSVDKQQAFAHFGGPHVLALVAEVSTRALKAVRYQKFNVHRRCRPERVAALIDRHMAARKERTTIYPELTNLVKGISEILDAVRKHNHHQNRAHADRAADPSARQDSYLLPMAFPEGSPMHPSYGAGHAVVAGACVTVLKAFFDSNAVLSDAHFVNDDGTGLCAVKLDRKLTVAGELNKLAENISIGRNWAGVHYFTDYIESMLLGEQIAIGLLEEQKLMFDEPFSMTLPKFDGTTIRI